VRAVEGGATVERVVLEDGTVLEADLVVVGIGASPVVEWLEGSGLTLDNGIVCDETMYRASAACAPPVTWPPGSTASGDDDSDSNTGPAAGSGVDS
jgi:NADPH-dependent 2,4-dienoyl-CoA reductase/sulfur reductase-like enzyme